jgi:hemin uptake protein HemP
MDMAISEEQSAVAAGRQPDKSHGERHLVVTDDRIDSRDLFSGTREITISHGDGIYRLRITSQNKLILTK